MKKFSLDKILYLSIISMPFTMYISGILLIYLIIKTFKIKYTNSYLPNHLNKLIILFFIYSLIQGIFSVNLMNHYIGLVANYSTFIVLFSILSKIVDTKNKIDNLTIYTIKSSFILSIIGIIICFLSNLDYSFFSYLDKNIINIEFYKDRASGISMNPNILAMYLILGIFLSLGYKFNTEKEINILNSYKTRYLDIIVLLSQFICLFFTYSRSILLTLFISLPILLKKLSYKIIYFLPIFIFISEKWLDRIINTLNFNHRESITRLFVWNKSLDIIKDYPFGIGILNFENTYKIYNVENFTLIPHVHNWYLQTFVESGFLGAILVFFIFFYIIYYFFYKLNTNDYYIPVSLIAFSIFNLTDYTLWDIRIKIIITIIIFIGFYKINDIKKSNY
jgi:O-antigen ligase